MRLLIVDDELLVKFGLESMIDFETLNIELIPSASNGKEALEKIVEFLPELVITDIKMPIMDGLELIEKCHLLNLKTKFIVLSSYDEFKIVKRTMQLGAIDYLIKIELNAKVLNDTLKETIEKIENENKYVDKSEKTPNSVATNEMLTIDFLRKSILGIIDLESDKTNKFTKEFNIQENERYTILSIKLINYPQNIENKELLNPQFVTSLITDILGTNKKSFIIIISKNQYAIYLNMSNIQQDLQYNKYISELAVKIIDKIKQTFNKKTLLGISENSTDISKLKICYEQSLKATELIKSNNSYPVYFYKEIEIPKLNINYLKLSDDFSHALNVCDEILLRKCFKEIYEQIENIYLRRNIYELCYKFIYIITLTGLKWENLVKSELDWDSTIFENIQTLLTVEEIKNWIEEIEVLLYQNINNSSSDMVEIKVKKTKTFILNNPYKKFSLTKLAQYLDITPSYLSTIFKRVEGVSLSDFITDVKVNEAKALLSKQTYKIYEVSAMLGYDDPYYFSKVFKKTTSLTPTEYICKLS